MAERRRIIPVSVGPFIKQEEAKPKKPTPRFTLSLAESTERECPEFCFSELMKNALGEEDETEQQKFNDLDEDDLTGITALARKFEQKYGPQKAKKKRQQIEDIIDAGLGYDENDPFVDNSECYDELVPSMLDTQLGGFYINSGQLNFKEIDASSDESDFLVHRKRKKNKIGKKKRSNSSESHHKEKKKKHKSSSLGDTPKKRGRKRLSGHEKKKKIKEKSNPTIAELLQRKAQVSTGVTDKSSPKTTPAPPLKNGSIIPSLEEDAVDLMGCFNLPLDSEMEQAMRDVMVDCENTMGMASDAEMSASANEGDSGSVAYTKCPEGLHEPLKINIMRIKEAARKSEEGKCKFFTNEVNNLLLDIEKQTRELSCGTRSTVYSHLSNHLPCGKETLLKRAKKLRLGEQDNKLKAPLQKLKEAVGRAMPSQLECYQEECQTAAQARYDKMMDGKERAEEAKSEEEDDAGGDKNKRSFAPRRKFTWNDSLRHLLCELVIVKVRAYDMLKSRSQSAEDYLKAFLEAEIKGFWPNGWMQTRMLFKESRSVHQHLTSTNAVKPKKLIPLPKKVIQVGKKSSSPVPPEMTASPAPSNSVSGGGLSYASSILKEMANTKGTPNVQKDVPTLLDYANENNALNKYPIYSSTAKAPAITYAANSSLKTSGTVSKTSPEAGSQSSNQHNVVKQLQAKDSGSHQSQLNAAKTANNKNFNDSFVNSLIAKTLKDVEKAAKKMNAGDPILPAGLSDLKLPDMSATFELLAGAAMQHKDAPSRNTVLKNLSESRQHSVGMIGLNQAKSTHKDKQYLANKNPVVNLTIIDKKDLKSPSMDLVSQTKVTPHQSSQVSQQKGYTKSPSMDLVSQTKVNPHQSSRVTQQKSYTNSSSTPHITGTMQKLTGTQSNNTPKWSGNSYLKMVDKTKQVPTQATQFTNPPRKMFNTVQDGKSTSKDKDALIGSMLPSNDVGSTSGVINSTNKQFLTPQHVSPKRTGQVAYMRSNDANVVPQRLSPSTPKQSLPQQVKPTNRTSPSALNNQSPTGSPSMSHSPISPIASPGSPSIMAARSLFHHPTSPQNQQTAAASMNLLGLNYSNNYSMQQLTGFQMQFADMAMKHSGNFAMPVGQGSPGHGVQPQPSPNQTSAEAVITGPAPGTFYYTQPSGSNPRFTQDSKGQMQHRIP